MPRIDRTDEQPTEKQPISHMPEQCCTQGELLTLLAKEKSNNYRLYRQNRLLESKISQLCVMLHQK